MDGSGFVELQILNVCFKIQKGKYLPMAWKLPLNKWESV